MRNKVTLSSKLCLIIIVIQVFTCVLLFFLIKSFKKTSKLQDQYKIIEQNNQLNEDSLDCYVIHNSSGKPIEVNCNGNLLVNPVREQDNKQ